MRAQTLAFFLALLAAALPAAATAQTEEPPRNLLTLAEGAVVLSASANASARAVADRWRSEDRLEQRRPEVPRPARLRARAAGARPC